MTKEFTTADLVRMQAAEDEKKELQLFLNRRFRQFAVLTNVGGNGDYIRGRSENYPFRVRNLLKPEMVKNAQGKEIEVFILEDSIGGDRFGTDYDVYHLPTEYVFDREEWTRKFLEAVDNGWAYVAIPKGHRSSNSY